MLIWAWCVIQEPQWPITCICNIPAWFGNTVYKTSFPQWSSIIYFSQIPRHFVFRPFRKEHKVLWWSVWALESETSGAEARLCCEPLSSLLQLDILRASFWFPPPKGRAVVSPALQCLAPGWNCLKGNLLVSAGSILGHGGDTPPPECTEAITLWELLQPPRRMFCLYCWTSMAPHSLGLPPGISALSVPHFSLLPVKCHPWHHLLPLPLSHAITGSYSSVLWNPPSSLHSHTPPCLPSLPLSLLSAGLGLLRNAISIHYPQPNLCLKPFLSLVVRSRSSTPSSGPCEVQLCYLSGFDQNRSPSVLTRTGLLLLASGGALTKQWFLFSLPESTFIFIARGEEFKTSFFFLRPWRGLASLNFPKTFGASPMKCQKQAQHIIRSWTRPRHFSISRRPEIIRPAALLLACVNFTF